METETFTEDDLVARLRDLGVDEEEILSIVGEAPPPPVAASRLNEDDEEEMKFLVHCFPNIPRSTLKAKLIECKHDLDATTDLLLNYDALRDESGPQMFDKRQKKLHKTKTRREKRVSANRSQDLELLASALEVSPDEAKRLYDLHDESVSKVLQNHFNATAWDMRTISTLVAEVERSRPRTGAFSAPSVSKSLSPSEQLLEDLGGQAITKKNVLEMKSRYITRMEQLSEQSRSHSQRQTTRHLASEYRQQATAIMEKLKELQILEFHMKTYNSQATAIDFHGMTVPVALALCEDKVDHWLGDTRSFTLELITGAGLHSEAGVPRIKNAVRRYLDQRNIKYEEQPGSLICFR